MSTLPAATVDAQLSDTAAESSGVTFDPISTDAASNASSSVSNNHKDNISSKEALGHAGFYRSSMSYSASAANNNNIRHPLKRVNLWRTPGRRDSH